MPWIVKFDGCVLIANYNLMVSISATLLKWKEEVEQRVKKKLTYNNFAVIMEVSCMQNNWVYSHSPI